MSIFDDELGVIIARISKRFLRIRASPRGTVRSPATVERLAGECKTKILKALTDGGFCVEAIRDKFVITEGHSYLLEMDISKGSWGTTWVYGIRLSGPGPWWR